MEQGEQVVQGCTCNWLYELHCDWLPDSQPRCMAGAEWLEPEIQINRVLASYGPLHLGHVEAFWTRLPSAGLDGEPGLAVVPYLCQSVLPRSDGSALWRRDRHFSAHVLRSPPDHGPILAHQPTLAYNPRACP